MYNLVSHLVYTAWGSDVIHSVINGHVVMLERQLTTLDEEVILTEMGRIGTAVRHMS